MKRQLLILIVLTLSIPSKAMAGQWDCAIWLCLPVGFAAPSCQHARAAMIRHLVRFQSPVPSFDSCQIPNATHPYHYTMKIGTAILMGYYTHGSLIVRPEKKIINGGSCNHRDTAHEEPRGCVRTLQSIKLYNQGIQMGLTYYRNKRGPDVEIPELTLRAANQMSKNVHTVVCSETLCHT